ncbi:MAG: hypothetical protein M1575_00195 [Patescibacteria group bacterium]|nr:hypothetical protein [Patescibacteria group bacterium]MCL5095146.1 hypothetical protein [Patescibacteria group bacterium]
MKIQDIGFLILLFSAFFIRSGRLAAGLGLLFLILAMPLFALWVFFTAQRFVIYAAAFFVLSITLQLVEIKRRRKE